MDSLRRISVLAVDIADLAADELEPLEGERGEPDLHGPRVIEAEVHLEVDVEPLGQRLESRDTLGTFEERGGPGDQQVKTGKSTGIDLVDELPKCVEALIADVAPNALDRLDLIQDDEHPCVARVPENREDPLEEIQRTEVVEVPLHTGVSLGRRSHVRLT
jgi:hypothetical protein